MTSRTQSLPHRGGRSALLLSFALLPTLTTGGSDFSYARYDQEQRRHTPIQMPARQAYPTPYLRLVGPPPLRFHEPPSPPAFELEPVATGPAYIESEHTSSVPAPSRPKTDQSVPIAPPTKQNVIPTAEKKAEEPDSIPILPDDTRRDVRPEDLLPFFQFPRNGGTTMGVRVPVPPQPTVPALPPSSATYRQQ